MCKWLSREEERINGGHDYKAEAHSYYEYKDTDRKFYEQYIKDFLPEEIFDVHVHLSLPEHFYSISSERKLEDWVLDVGHTLSVEADFFAYKELLPEQKVNILGFLFPIKEAKLDKSNSYIRHYIKQGKIKGLMITHPDWPSEKVRKELQEGCFSGIKPYPDFVTKVKGADVSVFEFLPHSHLKVANELNKIVLLHLPRKNRLRDMDNIREIKDIRQKYPQVKLLIAHIGRCYCSIFAKEGLKYFRNDSGILFDTAAVLNPEVYKIALDEIGPDRLLYGTDLPITFMRGMREWHGEKYVNFSSGNYIWNTNRKSREEEAKYTLFIYELIKACREGIEGVRLGKEAIRNIFFNNTKKLLDGEKVLK